MLIDVDKIIKVPTTTDNFFKHWLAFLKPYHNLTDRESQVLASLLKQRHQLSKSISDDILIDQVLWTEESKRTIRDECDISLPHFQVVIAKLKKLKVIIDNRINKKLIPPIQNINDGFKLVFYFKPNEN